jgi:1-acyl-sn-glycerol-3-phosphate acyltransferase
VKIPLFGFSTKERVFWWIARAKSRMEVFNRAQKRIDQGLSICIFPEGGVPDDESVLLDEFKDGAFRLAIEHELPIVPMTFADNKERFSYTFLSGSPESCVSKCTKSLKLKAWRWRTRKTLRH